MTFREEVKEPDIQHVREIVESTGFFYDYEVRVAVELVEERLAKGLESGYYFIFAEQAGKVVGYSCFGAIPCTQGSYDLYWIAVHKDSQAQGIGKMLLKKTEGSISRLGGRGIYVETSSRPQYEPTRQFYLHNQYQQEALLKDFYAPHDHKVIFIKRIK